MTFDPALKTFLRDRCANETLFTARGDRKGALRMAAPLSSRVRSRCGSGRLGRPGAPGSVRAGDRRLDVLTAAADADGADLGDFDDLGHLGLGFLFDDLFMLQSGGRTIYSGVTSGAKSHFESLGFNACYL